VCDWGQRSENHSLKPQWRCTEHHYVAELSRDQRKLQRMGHTLAVRVSEPRKAEQRLDQLHEALAGSDFNSYSNVLVGCIPPGRLAG
jgi:hypothetical protein